tara:strand:- start:250 stop:393 length:144 start_codon:yes stop_codon:yes gene_type:complete
LSSKFSILGNNINPGRDEVRKKTNAENKGLIGILTKIDTKRGSKDAI